ncbi:MAG: DUF1572 family protein [Planctomycetota bacterium]|jgi:uncharacterized damage-inducible protein DinB
MTFVEESVRYLRDQYLPRLRQAVGRLSETDLWWRPHAGTTSAGNLLLHVAGNVRQWILTGLGGEPDRRDRAAEFAADDGASGSELIQAVERTVLEACLVIEKQTDLDRPCTIQGFETTVRGAIYHVVEHLSWHAGQVVWIAKMRGGERHGIAFYDETKLNEP